MQQKGITSKLQGMELIHRLTEELRTLNISHEKRMEFELKLERCTKECQSSAGNVISTVNNQLHEIDLEMAYEALHQAESEISKKEKTSSDYLGLENIRKELDEGILSPGKARHEIKNIYRHR